MDKDIISMFETKNKEIFINSLTLEMDRNLETLKSTTDNIVSLEINKLILFFKDFFIDYSIDYTKEELIGFLYKEKIEINNIVNERIEEKKKSIRDSFFKEEVPEKIITNKFLDKYYSKLKEETESLNNVGYEGSEQKSLSRHYRSQLPENHQWGSVILQCI